LQDKDDVALNFIKELIAPYHETLNVKITNFSEQNIIRCLACDICPTHIDIDEEYRCIIKSKNDDLQRLHEELLEADAIIPVAYSPVDREGLHSNYQRLMERTRYFRRGDYVFSDLMTAPMVIDEIGSNENLHIRMMTSMIRHHTVVSKPMIAYTRNGNFVNKEDVQTDFEAFNLRVRQMIRAKMIAYASEVNHLRYNPVGYVLSAAKEKEDQKLSKRRDMIETRIAQAKKMVDERIVKA